MINLLPPELKANLSYARRSSLLFRVSSGLFVGLAALVLVVGGALFYLQQEVNGYNKSIAQTEAMLEQRDEAATIAQVQDVSDSLKLAVTVLSDEVLFSELLQQIGAVMPSGSVLKGLSLNSDLTGGVDLQASARDYTTASQVLVNLQDADNKIFKKADLQNITCDTEADPTYPCLVTLRALFSDQNSFLLVSPAKDKKQ